MKVTKSRFEDVGEQDDNGYYNYYYAGFIYNFSDNDRTLVARSYDDTPDEVSFIRFNQHVGNQANPKGFKSIPYSDPLFKDAIQYLVNEVNASVIKILLDDPAIEGYSLIDVNSAIKP